MWSPGCAYLVTFRVRRRKLSKRALHPCGVSMFLFRSPFTPRASWILAFRLCVSNVSCVREIVLDGDGDGALTGGYTSLTPSALTGKKKTTTKRNKSA